MISVTSYKRDSIRAAVALGAVFGLAYIGWCAFGPRPLPPGAATAAKIPAAVADLPRKEVTPAKVSVFKDKRKVAERLNLPASMAAEEKEEVFEASEAPASRHGTITVTYMNMSTGKPRSVVKAKEAPWFSFERGNEIGVEGGISPQGKYLQADYQREVFSVKGAVFGVHPSVTFSEREKPDYRVGIRAKYCW